ncbi:hypothetical protein [Sphaerochaeta sp.]|uniref:hypothetical protein n=1 Tax=Sphaerochaeta sp. TaxID=1972642 RepID=UPI00258E6FA0|nr:hypothetical protein [Sphaerochaeta sp.]MDD3457769.1 hypothetical protein [Sphaerochaeta sp.]
MKISTTKPNTMGQRFLPIRLFLSLIDIANLFFIPYGEPNFIAREHGTFVCLMLGLSYALTTHPVFIGC